MITEFKKQIKRNKKTATGAILMLIIIFLAIIIPAPFIQSLYIIFGCLATIFLPGLFFTFIFFPKTISFAQIIKSDPLEPRKIDWIERIVLSLFFSLALVIIGLTIIRQVNIELTFLRVSLFIIVLNIACLVGAMIVWMKYNNIK